MNYRDAAKPGQKCFIWRKKGHQDLDKHDDTLTANYELQQGTAADWAVTSITRILNVPKQRV